MMFPKDDLFAYIKLKTSDLHTEVEKSIPLMSAEVCVGDYTNYLSKIYGFYVGVEARIAKFDTVHPDYFDILFKFKVNLISQDLQALGVPHADLGNLPRWVGRGEIMNVSQLIGILYVTEGATLNGRKIMKNLCSALALSDSKTTFFRGYASATGEMWTELRRNSHSFRQNIDQDEAASSALELFSELSLWLKTSDVHFAAMPTG